MLLALLSQWEPDADGGQPNTAPLLPYGYQPLEYDKRKTGYGVSGSAVRFPERIN